MSDVLARWAPLAGMVVFAIWLNVWTTVRRRADGESPIARSGSENRAARSVYMNAGWLFVLYAFAAGLAPGAVARLGAIAALDQTAVRWAGVATVVVGVGVTIGAQIQMGKAWRMGVPETAPAGLVTTGFFHVSRNPIYLGINLLQLGVVLCAPTWAALAVWLVGVAAGDVYVRSEERFLAESFGDPWTAYRRRVRRWI